MPLYDNGMCFLIGSVADCTLLAFDEYDVLKRDVIDDDSFFEKVVVLGLELVLVFSFLEGCWTEFWLDYAFPILVL